MMEVLVAKTMCHLAAYVMKDMRTGIFWIRHLD